jgi:hypothetical protein
MDNPVLSYIFTRLKEPSTYAGLASFAVALKLIPNDPTLVQGVTTVGIAVAGILASLMPEAAKTVVVVPDGTKITK